MPGFQRNYILRDLLSTSEIEMLVDAMDRATMGTMGTRDHNLIEFAAIHNILRQVLNIGVTESFDKDDISGLFGILLRLTCYMFLLGKRGNETSMGSDSDLLYEGQFSLMNRTNAQLICALRLRYPAEPLPTRADCMSFECTRGRHQLDLRLRLPAGGRRARD